MFNTLCPTVLITKSIKYYNIQKAKKGIKIHLRCILPCLDWWNFIIRVSV